MLFRSALAFAVLGLGFLARGLDSGKYRSTAAVLIALSALSHGIVLIFVFGGAAVMVLLHVGKRRLVFGVTTVGAAVLLSAFWVFPFLTAHKYMTDMKYEARPSGAADSFWDMYFPHTQFWDILVMSLALVGFAAAILRRKVIGVWLGVMMIILFIGVYVTRESLPVIGLLWNPRLLPFLYLCRYFLAMLGVWAIASVFVRLVMDERGTAADAPASVTATSLARNAVAWTVAIGVLVGYLIGGGPVATAVAFVIALVMAVTSYWKSDQIALRVSRAVPADPATYQRLHNLVEGLCIASGLPKPRVYVIEDEIGRAHV